jgi:hypothetical protein
MTFFDHSIQPSSGRGYKDINGKIYYRRGLPFTVNLIKYMKYYSNKGIIKMKFQEIPV